MAIPIHHRYVALNSLLFNYMETSVNLGTLALWEVEYLIGLFFLVDAVIRLSNSRTLTSIFL